MSHWFSRRQVADVSNAHASARKRSLATDVLHLFALTSFAIAQPVYDRLSSRFVFLLEQSITPSAVRLLVFLLSCALPMALAFLAIVIGSWRRQVQDAFHSIIVFVCLVLIALPICSRMHFLPGSAMLCLALAAAGLGVWCYFRFQWSRSLVSWSALGALLFPAIFLYQHSASTSITGSPGSRSERWNPVPVVLVVFDEFCGATLMTPERDIDAERFPNFAALARQSTWFRNASTVSPLTVQAVPAILSGRYPTTKDAPGPADLPHNLLTVLSSTGGYELAAFEPVSKLGLLERAAKGHQPHGVWRQTRYLIETLSRVYLFHITPQDYQIELPEIPKIWFGYHEYFDRDRELRRGVFEYSWNSRRDDQFQHFLDCLDGSPRPAFHFGHFLLPHLPWCYLPSRRCYRPDIQNSDLACLGSEGMRPLDEFAATQQQQRYLLQVMYVDTLIGKLLSRLTETGMLDRCLLIITADHGVSFRTQQPRRELEAGNQDEILSVPLFIKRPGQTVGNISDRAVETVDILPTVADVIGLNVQAPTDGWSVFDDSRSERHQLTVRDKQGVRHFDPACIQESVAPAVLRNRFGSGSDPDAVFAIGPCPELIGRTVADLPVTTDAPVEIDLLTDQLWLDPSDDDPTAMVPSYFEGLVLSPRPADEVLSLAVAINGTIRAVTRTYRSSEFQNRWAALVPEWSFHAGKNDIRFYVVNRDAGSLTPCTFATP